MGSYYVRMLKQLYFSDSILKLAYVQYLVHPFLTAVTFYGACIYMYAMCDATVCLLLIN